jgi:uncharacterized membrane protein YfcA
LLNLEELFQGGESVSISTHFSALLDIDLYGMGILAFCAAFVGFSKSALPGAIIFIVPLSACVLPAKTAVGVVLPLLMFGDLLTTGYFSRKINFTHMKYILPSAFCGVCAGYFAMGRMSSQALEPVIGWVVLIMLALKVFLQMSGSSLMATSREYDPGTVKAPRISLFFGLSMGTVATIAHAAGPLTALYLILNRFPKKEFIATSAGFFLFINWMKVPFYLKLGILNWKGFKLDLLLFPFIILGFLTGLKVLKYISQRKFDVLVQVLAFMAAVKLII